MRTYFLVAAAAVAVSACAPSVPDSAAAVPDPGTGVGFGNYSDYATRREAQLSGTSGPIPISPEVISGPIGSSPAGSPAARAAEAALAANSGVAPLEASPSNPPPQVVANARGISGENDFTAVSATRDIAADAAMIERNRSQYTLVVPEALPAREDGGPNIVEYALRTTNPVGTALYKRSALSTQSGYQRACARYTSSDLAQEDFLASGGPERDRKGLDPDGDGFACGWSPAPFRKVRGG